MEFPKVPLYLFYGTQAEAILGARDSVLARVVPPELRDENLTEYYPSGKGDTVRLADLLDEIAGDMATISFIADAAKCVIVTNPAEVFGSGERPGKKEKSDKAEKAEAGLARWLERDLPETGHTLIMIALEDEAAGREVDERGPLYQLIQKVGYTRKFADTKAFFRIEESIVRRQPAACIEAVRDLWKAGRGGGDVKVYNSVVRTLRYLIQADLARIKKWDQDPAAQGAYLPGDAQRNIFKAHANVKGKYLGKTPYRTKDLLKAFQGTLEVYRALRPRPEDQYVPDAQGLMEQILIELMTAPRP